MEEIVGRNVLDSGTTLRPVEYCLSSTKSIFQNHHEKGLVTCQGQMLAWLRCNFKQETLPPEAGPALWSVHTPQASLRCD